MTEGTTTHDAPDFWKEVLAGFASPTPLPAGIRTLQPQPGTARRNANLQLPAVAVSALTSFFRGLNLELNVAVPAAWAILLSRFSGQEDVVFGLASGDAQPVPVRLHLDPEQTVEGYLMQAASMIKACLLHQNPPPDLAPLFETVVSYIPSRNQSSAFPLMVALLETAGGGMEVTADYEEARFLRNAVPSVLENLGALLMQMPTHGKRKLSELPLVGDDQLDRQLIRWNATQVDYPGNVCVHELFEERVRRSPDRTALTCQGDSLSYQELDRRSNQVAHYLRQHGAGAEQIVAICVERSLEMMVGLLGILKAGSAYLPLDPTYPSERLHFMLQDSGARFLLTKTHLAARFQSIPQQILNLDLDLLQRNVQDGIVPANAANGQNLAYVIYTSGSTGRPKGVMIEHRQVVNFFAGMDQILDREPGVWLAVTTISFDISVLELFWTLARGFHVVLQAEGDRLSPDGEFSIAAQIVKHRVSHLQCTPSLVRLLLSIPDSREALASLQKLIIGGEAFPPSLAADVSRSTSARIYNMYGPTETTIWSTAYRLEKNETIIPIGRPIANTLIYILDKHSQPVPIGAPGELCIGGAGVARGYLNRPENSREKFSPNPFRPQSHERIYRTGDLARYWPTGDLEFLGRIDHQIKILGFRVEVEEIEAILGQHPGVLASAVVPHENPSGEIRLVAHLVPRNQDEAPLPSELRNFLSEKLPPQMVPSAFLLLGSLPYTMNGKIDRKLLSGPANDPGQRHGTQCTQEELESLISDIWKETLGITSISSSRNFFDLGANSMLMLEVASRLSDSCKTQIAVTDLFRYPTVAALAAHLSKHAESSAQSSAGSTRIAQRKSRLRSRANVERQ